MIPFEQDNLQAYSLLLRIEIVLRECLKESMEGEFGAKWQKRIPGDLLKKVRMSQSEENKPQFDFLRLGPLYYLTFGELLQLLQQELGRSVTRRLGGESLVRQLENLFSPRNAICHSRSVSRVGLKAVEALYGQLESALTPEVMSRLLANPDAGLRQVDAARGLARTFEQALYVVAELPLALPIPDDYERVTAQFWWGEDTLAGFHCACVEACVALIVEYNSLPVGVAAVLPRQRLVETSNFEVHLREALSELRKVAQ